MCTSAYRPSFRRPKCVQVVLESPKDGRHYVFELKDRLIRDKDLDGQTEIPVKPAADDHLQKHDHSKADGHADVLDESTSATLQGLSCFPRKMLTFLTAIPMPCAVLL